MICLMSPSSHKRSLAAFLDGIDSSATLGYSSFPGRDPWSVAMRPYLLPMLSVRWMSVRMMVVPKEDEMGLRFCSTFLISLLLLGLPAAYADDASEGRDLFLRQCLGCHAFACNKQGPKLGGLFGRKAASVADYKGYSQEPWRDPTRWSNAFWRSALFSTLLASQMAASGQVETFAGGTCRVRSWG